jgi:hypothetical protein
LGAAIIGIATENHSASASGTELGFYTTPNGTSGANNYVQRMVIANSGSVGIGTTSPCATNPPANCKLSVSGGIQAQEVVVNTGWSDYVFQPTYHLRPLSEIAAYIQENHHLPGIPTEGEVKERGVSLGDMQAKLLAKVEELTLHMIEADERSKRDEERNKTLEQQNRELQERIARLEAAAQNPKDREK